MWYTSTVEHCSSIKQDEILPFPATWMNTQMVILSEISQRKTIIINTWNLKKMIQMNLFTNIHNRLTQLENKFIPKEIAGGGVGREKLGCGMKYTRYYIKTGKQQGPAA